MKTNYRSFRDRLEQSIDWIHYKGMSPKEEMAERKRRLKETIKRTMTAKPWNWESV
ncbi:MAG: hypothetical protein GY861_00875, partial [bacterium]|nr:hypothetical protein [bacterium]